MKESAAASHVRLFAAYAGIELWRNNVGVLPDRNGRPVRYGLCNDSAALNKEVKSSDYIGITPVLVTQDMVGTIVGVFTAIETKETGWHLTPGDERGLAQQKFHDIVKKSGGYAGFATCVEDFRKIVRK